MIPTIRAVIADDEPLARERLRTLLAGDPDIDVVAECGDGCETIQTVEALLPDLLFLDVQMPELDGVGVVEALQARLTDRDEQVLRLAAVGLSKIGRGDAVRRTEVLHGLAEALRTADAVEGTYILRALYDFGETSPETGQAVAAVLHELDGTAFHCAIGIIGNSGARDPDTVIVMHAAERRCDEKERKWLRHMLAKIAPPPKATSPVDPEHPWR